MTDDLDDVLDALLEVLDERERPVAKTVEVADILDVSRPTATSRLYQLVARGDAGTDNLGGTRVWWPAQAITHALTPAKTPANTGAQTPPGSGVPADNAQERARTDDSTPAQAPAKTDAQTVAQADPHPDAGADAAALEGAGDDVIPAIVDAAAKDWQGDVQERREAAESALEWLRDHGERVSGSDVRTALVDEHGVASESDETWWRKTVRPAFQEAADAGAVEYREGHYDYKWVRKSENPEQT